MGWVGDADPEGGRWLICEGRALNSVDYPDLYAVIGTKYNTGGESAGAFRIPDFRGRVSIGAGDAPDLSDRPIGQKLGAETHTLALTEMASHDHGALTGNTAHDHGAATGSTSHDHGGYTNTVTHNHGGDSYISATYISGLAGGGSSSAMYDYTYQNDVVDSVSIWHTIPSEAHTHTISSNTHNHSISAAGGGGAHNNMQPSLAEHRIIRVLI